MEKKNQLSNLEIAERAIRANLHEHDLDETARDHLHRALAHVQEAFVAINEVGKARSVNTLHGDLGRVERLLAATKPQPTCYRRTL